MGDKKVKKEHTHMGVYGQTLKAYLAENLSVGSFCGFDCAEQHQVEEK